jgi:hypothetical protein
MSRRSNKSVADIFTKTNVSPLGNEYDKHLALLNRKITLNSLTICDYVIAMKREINLRLSYKRSTIAMQLKVLIHTGFVN